MSSRKKPPTPPLAFEKPIFELENQLKDLESQSDPSPATKDSIRNIRVEITRMRREIFMGLNAWQTVEVARHPDRPQVLDYIELILDEFVELHGDHAYRDDRSIKTGFAKIGDEKVLFVGQHKGRNLDERTEYNYGMAHPEGYRKALSKMEMAAGTGCRLSASSTRPEPTRASERRTWAGLSDRAEPARNGSPQHADHFGGDR